MNTTPLPADPVETAPPAGAVLVGVDGSEHDVVVLTAAVAEAIGRRAPLHVRHCRELLDASLTMAAQAPVLIDESIDTSGAIVAAAVETVRTLDTSLQVTADRPAGRADNLLVTASQDAQLVVVGTGRKSRLDEFLLGAVALNVAAHAGCPVLVVPPGADPDGEGPVVVGVDGSSHSQHALALAVAAARRRSAAVQVLTTWNLEVVNGYVVTERDSPEWRAVEDRIRAMQESMVAKVDTHDVDVSLAAVKGGIRSTLAEHSTDAALLVVGNRGRGGFKAKALGSVTMDVLKRATCPILVVHDGD